MRIIGIVVIARVQELHSHRLGDEVRLGQQKPPGSHAADGNHKAGRSSQIAIPPSTTPLYSTSCRPCLPKKRGEMSSNMGFRGHAAHKRADQYRQTEEEGRQGRAATSPGCFEEQDLYGVGGRDTQSRMRH